MYGRFYGIHHQLPSTLFITIVRHFFQNIGVHRRLLLR